MNEQSTVLIPGLLNIFNLWKDNQTDSEAFKSLTILLGTFARFSPSLLDEFRPLLSDERLALRQAGLLFMYAAGPNARSASPEILNALQSDETQALALMAFGRVGTQAELVDPRVLAIFNVPERHESLLEAISSIGINEDTSPILLPHVLQLLESPKYLIRHQAVAILKHFLRFNLGPIGMIVDTCRAHPDDFYLRELAAMTFKSQWPAVQTHLNNFLRASDEFEQLIALKTANFIGPNALPLIEEISPLLQSPRPNIRAAALYALQSFGEASRSVSANVKRLLQDPNQEIQLSAIDALGTIGAVTAIDDLKNYLSHPNATFRYRSAYALSHFGPTAAAAIPQLLVQLEDPSSYIVITALKTLQALEARDAIPTILNSLDHADIDVREAAAKVLADLARNPQAPQPVEMPWIDSVSLENQWLIAKGLGVSGNRKNDFMLRITGPGR